MTREEILGIPSYPHECGSMIEVHTRQDALKAMSEFAQQEAIAFAEWTQKKYYEQDDDGLWYKWLMRSRNEDPSYTTTELYSLFKQQP